MTDQIVSCPGCGQKNRLPSDSSRRGIAKCGKCGTVLLRQGMPEATPSQAPEPAPGQQDRPETPPSRAPEPARGGTRETRLTFSWPVALKSLSIGVGIAAVGVAIAVLGGSTGAMIGGGILALIGLGGLGLMLADGLGGSGSCPICSAEIVATSNSEPYKLCPGCREYLAIKDGLIRQVDLSAIATTPIFAVPTPWEDLKAVTYTPEGNLITARETRALHATWPNACCVCGEPASRLEDRDFLIYKWNGELIRANQTMITLQIVGAPYCGVHSKGVAIDKINFRSKGDDDLKPDLVLVFRSYAYRNKFLELNRWPWR